MTETKNPTCTSRYTYASLALLALAGCVERGESSFPDQEFAAPDAGEEVDAGEAALGEGGGAGTMTGTWLRVHEASMCVLRNEQLTVTDYLVRVEGSGATLTERVEICAVALTPILGLEVGVPPAAFASVELPEVDRGYVSGVGPGAGYTSPTELSLWGFTSDDPIDAALPRDPDDPAVYDADADGNPGVTFTVGGACERYVTQRQFIRYLGSFTGGNRIDGSSIAFTESSVLDATSAICASAPALTPNDDDNRFVMVRVDGAGGAYDADLDADGAITCAEVQGLGAQLIPPREPARANCVQ